MVNGPIQDFTSEDTYNTVETHREQVDSLLGSVVMPWLENVTTGASIGVLNVETESGWLEIPVYDPDTNAISEPFEVYTEAGWGVIPPPTSGAVTH